MNIRERLFKLRDEQYADFQAKLTPNIPKESFIGVRVPDCRIIAKQIIKENCYKDFLDDLPHKYYDENMLHGILLSFIKDYDLCISKVNEFLPYVDNWAVCDIMSPKIFKKHKDELLAQIKVWTESDKEYTCRFGLEMLMSHYLDEDFKSEYLEIPASIKSEHYYVKMMVAWFYATALTKQWDDTFPYLHGKIKDSWTHNKTIQKACESYRISDEQKTMLRTLKR